MDKLEVKQQLLQLESREVVQRWFKIIHDRQLNVIRTKEINFAAKQASEYFKNAELANYTVRPLLTYYGINMLSRALVLLLKKFSGENTLIPSHGLEASEWSQVLFGSNINEGLNKIGMLKVKTCKGLFSELVNVTNNKTTIHVNSSAVNWRIEYKIPDLECELTLNEILERIPNFKQDLNNIRLKENFASVIGASYTNNDGFQCDSSSQFDLFKDSFLKLGYNIEQCESSYKIRCSSELLVDNPPLFYHDYVKTVLGIPHLFIVKPFRDNIYYSEIAITFMLSYILGMFVRYYPTHWTSLVHGENGDMYWPILNRAQNYVEIVYPKLILELINDILDK